MTSQRRHDDHHNHGHADDHEHGHEHANGLRQQSRGGKRDLLIALSITLLMMIVEAIGGLLSNSLALISDAGHMLTDNLALLLSFFAMKFATLPATEKRTFGFYRLEILAALINGIILVVISLYIIYQSYLRMIHPQRVEGMLMLIVAVIGLVANISGAVVLMKHSHSNLNIRGAYLHIVGDAFSSIGVVVGGIIILYTGWYLIDPILSILISFVIIYGAWALVKESVSILLESVPSHIDIETVATAISQIRGVREAYHIHVWTITSGVHAMSAHVLIDDQLVSRSRDLINDIKSLLAEKFKILHSTIQLECERCDMNPICSLPNNVQMKR
ncbi:MAG TPA: cation diffusion facilitator family transporter [Nitrospirota bacterium]|nr:cation diffusion facilitator family transporter [Nitrospirota bacterium]